MTQGPVRKEQIGEPLDLRHLFPLQRSQLVELLTGLDRDAWLAPTSCPGWTVGDIAAHILGDQVARLSASRDRWVPSSPKRAETIAATVDRTNDEWVEATRRLSPEIIIELIDWSGSQLDSHWQTVDLDAPALGVPWAGIDPAPAWFDIAREFTEYWVHHQQIRDATSGEGGDSPWRGAVLDVFARGLPYRLGLVEEPPTDRVAVVAEGSDETMRWAFRSTPEGWIIAPAAFEPEGSPEVRVDAQRLWRRWVRDESVQPDRNSEIDPLAEAVLDHVAIIRGPD